MYQLTYTVTGLQEVVARLRAGKDVLRAAMEDGMAPALERVREEMRKAPAVGSAHGGSGLFNQRTGGYQASLETQMAWRGHTAITTLTGTVRPNLAQAPYAPMLASGTGLYNRTSPHLIHSPSGKAMAIPLSPSGVAHFLARGEWGGRNAQARMFIFRHAIRGMRPWDNVARAAAASPPLVLAEIERALTGAIAAHF